MRIDEIVRYQEDGDGEGGSTFTHDGQDYDLNALFVLTDRLATQEFAICDLDWILDEVDEPADPVRVAAAEPEVPVLITPWQGKLVVIDGFHRLTKAKRLGHQTIMGKLVPPAMLAKVRLDGDD